MLRRLSFGNRHNNQSLDEDAEDFDEEEKNKSKIDNEYYSFMHVPRNASQEEISTAYKKLSRQYHPDKFQDETNKKRAEVMFAKLQEAYRVLGDPDKRATYDCLGKEFAKNGVSLKETYQRLAAVNEDYKVLASMNQTSKMDFGIDASDLFERYMYEEFYDDAFEPRLPSISISEVSLGQTIDVPVTTFDTITISGTLSQYAKTGQGSLSCSWLRNPSQESWQRYDCTVAEIPSLSATYFRNLTEKVRLTMSGSTQLYSNGLRPSFNISLAHVISKRLTGRIVYHAGFALTDEYDDSYVLAEEMSYVSTSMTYSGQKWTIWSVLQLGIPSTNAKVGLTWNFSEKVKLRAVSSLGTRGIFMEYGIQRQISKHNNLSCFMTIGIPHGVVLKIRLSRGSQTYRFPVYLSDEILFQPIFYGTVIPILGWFAIKKLYLDPKEEERKRKELEKEREIQSVKLAEAKKDASHAVEMMREQYFRIYSNESAKNGLVIIVALYGKLVNDLQELLPEVNQIMQTANCNPDEVEVETHLTNESGIANVTIPTQCLVDNNRLMLYEGSKIGIAGFYDPCFGETKHLLIRYTFQGKTHQAMIQDSEELRCPRISHQL